MNLKRTKKQLNYMPIPGRYIREPFEFNRYIGPLIGLKTVQKLAKTANMLFLWGPFKVPTNPLWLS